MGLGVEVEVDDKVDVEDEDKSDGDGEMPLMMPLTGVDSGRNAGDDLEIWFSLLFPKGFCCCNWAFNRACSSRFAIHSFIRKISRSVSCKVAADADGMIGVGEGFAPAVFVSPFPLTTFASPFTAGLSAEEVAVAGVGAEASSSSSPSESLLSLKSITNLVVGTDTKDEYPLRLLTGAPPGICC